MGGSRSSSKRKSSSRKSSKMSSEARKKKRSKRTKSRKLRRRDDPSSYASDDSRSLVSISTSSSEDEYSRARSRTRSEVKKVISRKRTRRSSSSRGGSGDSRHAKKKRGLLRKRSKKSSNSDTRKKSQKKRRRERSVSSISSDSRSCSTCRNGSVSGESEFERTRGRSREKSKDKRGLGKAKIETKSNRNGSRSCSSCSRHSDSSGYNRNDIQSLENNTRRLRSVITVAKSSVCEAKEWDRGGHKEEIIYDHDDYPSRSNDSNDGGSKREIAHHSHVNLERREVENVKGEEALVSDIRMIKHSESVEVAGVQDCQSNSHSDGAGANSSSQETTSEVLPTLSSSNGDNLESTLRLKALENLRKYRGGCHTHAKPPAVEKNKSDGELKQLSTAKVEFVQNASPKEDSFGIVGATRVLDQDPNPTIERDFSHPATSYVKVDEGKGTVTECASAKRSVVRKPNQVAISINSRKEVFSPAGAVSSKSELGKSALRQESSGSILKQTDKANMLVAEGNLNKNSADTSESVGQTSNNNGLGVNNLRESSTPEPSSSLKPTLEEHSSKDQQGEAKEGSQFEEKTMSVMRGGEMVQVSYKVYIPKKVPALARRQLRR